MLPHVPFGHRLKLEHTGFSARDSFNVGIFGSVSVYSHMLK